MLIKTPNLQLRKMDNTWIPLYYRLVKCLHLKKYIFKWKKKNLIIYSPRFESSW